jgi:hypothetical protein
MKLAPYRDAKKMKHLFLFCLLVATTMSCSAFALSPSEFRTTDNDVEFADIVKRLDFNDPDIRLKYKDGGTSVGMKVKRGDEKIGKWAPPNSATDPESQVVAYMLGRFLGTRDLVVPSAYYVVDGPALATFVKLLNSAGERNKWRSKNRGDNLERAKRGQILGVFMVELDIEKAEVKGLANDDANTINRKHPIARFIRADGPVPSSSSKMKLDGIKGDDGSIPTETELELARQFSDIMVLDILTGEWDRFSGGNIEGGHVGDRAVFISRDNGGASMVGAGNFGKYSSIVTRFNRFTIERLQKLVQLLSDPNEKRALVEMLQLKSDPKFLLARCNQVLAHVRALVAKHGEKAVYF